MRVNFEIKGITSLLMHHDNIEGADRISEWINDPVNKNVSRAGDDRTPAWTWQEYLYTDGEHVCVPAENLMVALREAGKQIKLRGAKTFKAITQTHLLIKQEFIELLVSDERRISMADIDALREEPFKKMQEEVEALGFRLFIKRARVGTAKHIRVRPRFDEWMLRGSIEVNAPEITLEKLQLLFDLAGRVGLCDWRPGCKTPGPYGQFTARVWKA